MTADAPRDHDDDAAELLADSERLTAERDVPTGLAGEEEKRLRGDHTSEPDPDEADEDSLDRLPEGNRGMETPI